MSIATAALAVAGFLVSADDTKVHRGAGFTLSYPEKNVKLDPPSARVPFQLEYRKNTLVRLETERLTQPIDLSDETFAKIFMEVQLERLHERVSVPLHSSAVRRYPWGTGIEFTYYVPARSGKRNERDYVIEVVTTVDETLYRFTTWIPERDLNRSAAPMAALVASFRPEGPAAQTTPAVTLPSTAASPDTGIAAMAARIESYRRQVQESRDSADAQAGLAASLGLKGYLTESISGAEIEEIAAAAAAALRLAPDSAASQRARAWAAFHKSQMVEMEEAIQKAIRAEPDAAESHLLYALWYGFNPERSESMARKAIDADPQLAPAYFVKALADRRAGDLAEAKEALERAVTLDPGFTRARKELADILEERGELEASLTVYRFLVRELPRDVGIHFRLAVVARKHGLIDEAISRYESALELDPALAEAHYNLAVLYLREKQQPQLAAQRFKRFLELDPEGDRAETVRKWLRDNGY